MLDQNLCIVKDNIRTLDSQMQSLFWFMWQEELKNETNIGEVGKKDFSWNFLIFVDCRFNISFEVPYCSK